VAFPINNKQDLIDALKELSDSELSEANLQKKGSVDPSSPENQKKIQQLKEEAELQKRIADAVGDLQESNKQSLKIQEQLLQQLNLQELALTDRIELNEKELEIAKQLEEFSGKRIESVQDLVKAEEEVQKKLKISTDNGKEYRDVFKSIAEHIGMSDKGAAKLVNSTKKLAEGLKDNAEKQAEFARAFVSTFNVTNAIAAVFTSFAESMVRNLFMLDQVAANFAAATGAGRGFTGVIQEAQANSRGLGVSLEESGKATQALFEGFIGFTDASKGTQIALAETTAQLGKFGVDGQSAVNLLNFFSENLGKSTEESAALTKELAMMGPRIGISTAKITRDFQSALPTLAVYGDKSVEVFQGLAGAARMAGVETSKLLDLANQFDTFAGSAETAGKLNAILGTQISAMEMLNMKENERIETLISSVQATGVAFKDLGRFEQKAIAAAAGISDLSEAQRIFGMSLSAFRDQQREMDKSVKVQEEFNKALQDMMPLKEKFMSLFARFVPIVTPALELIHDFADGIATMLDKMTPEQQRLIGGIAMAISGFVVVLTLLAPMLSVLSSLSTGLGLIAPAAGPAGAAIAGLGKAFGAFFSAIATPAGILGLIAVTGAIMGVVYALSLYNEQSTKEEEAKARQIEGNVALAESFGEIGGNLTTLSMATFEKPIAGLQAMAQALGQFQDVSVDARATLTNLALISAGKAADSANNARIVAAGAATINNNINNSFAPTMTLEIDGQEFKAMIKDIQYNTANASG
jgi:hypothetical protein